MKATNKQLGKSSNRKTCTKPVSHHLNKELRIRRAHKYTVKCFKIHLGKCPGKKERKTIQKWWECTQSQSHLLVLQKHYELKSAKSYKKVSKCPVTFVVMKGVSGPKTKHYSPSPESRPSEKDLFDHFGVILFWSHATITVMPILHQKGSRFDFSTCRNYFS